MNAAFVKIWNEVAGAVLWDEQTGYATFEYDQNFKKLMWELSPLRMPLTESRSIYSFPELRRDLRTGFDTFKGLPGLLADVLPDKYGNQLIETWLSAQGRNGMNPVEMLCFIGTRGMGALEFEPVVMKEGKRSFSIEVDELVAIATRLLAERTSFSANTKKEEEQAMLDILKIGTSAGGARPKAVIAFNETTGEVRSGQATAPKGFEHWLIKLDGVSNVQFGEGTGYGRVEMAYYLMAIDCGIEMMPSRLLEENGRAHFMTKRFDREDGDVKHHIQTFCALKHFDFNEVLSFSYEQLFQTMRELKLTYPEAEQMFRRMVFNVMARNCDDHTKNFSFRLKKGGRWELAPAYDVCHAYKPGHQWVSQHALSMNGKRTGITKDDLLLIGKSIQCKQATSIIDETEAVIFNWKKYAKETGVPVALRNEIFETIKSRQ
ncbi:MAG: type II toxin-antitoxin system HipA family toxin [Bacteroidia bacterium]